MIKNEDITQWETEAGNLTAYPLTAALSPVRYKKKKQLTTEERELYTHNLKKKQNLKRQMFYSQNVLGRVTPPKLVFKTY